MRTKIVPVIIGASETIKELIRPELSVAPRSPVGHRTTERHTNEHCTQHSVSAGVNCFDILLRSGLTRRLPPGN